MKFDLHPPELDEASADAQAVPEQPGPAPGEEPDSGVRGRYGRAVGSALSALAQLSAHTRGHPADQEPLEHDAHAVDSDDSDDSDGDEAVFRPGLFSAPTGGE